MARANMGFFDRFFGPKKLEADVEISAPTDPRRLGPDGEIKDDFGARAKAREFVKNLNERLDKESELPGPQSAPPKLEVPPELSVKSRSSSDGQYVGLEEVDKARRGIEELRGELKRSTEAVEEHDRTNPHKSQYVKLDEVQKALAQYENKFNQYQELPLGPKSVELPTQYAGMPSGPEEEVKTGKSGPQKFANKLRSFLGMEEKNKDIEISAPFDLRRIENQALQKAADKHNELKAAVVDPLPKFVENYQAVPKEPGVKSTTQYATPIRRQEPQGEKLNPVELTEAYQNLPRNPKAEVQNYGQMPSQQQYGDVPDKKPFTQGYQSTQGIQEKGGYGETPKPLAGNVAQKKAMFEALASGREIMGHSAGDLKEVRANEASAQTVAGTKPQSHSSGRF